MRFRGNKIFDAIASLALLAVGVWFALDYGSCVLHLNIDFQMRYNEARAVLVGADPYLIWKGVLPAGSLTPFDFCFIHEWFDHQFVHAYPPWSYAFMLPLAFLGFPTACCLYWGLELAIVFAIFSYAIVRLRRVSGVWWPSCLCFALMCWCASDAFTRCLVVGNYGIIVTGAVLIALCLHERKREALAGVAWSLTMLKPQLGGLFLLTLLLERKWRTLTVVGMVLGVATLVSAVLCGRSPVAMMLSIGEYSRGMFDGTGFFVPPIFQALVQSYGESTVLLASAALGVVLCAALWSLVRNCKGIWVRFVPAMLLSVAWTTFRLHDMSLQLLPAIFVVLVAFVYRTRAVTLTSILLGASLGIREGAYYWAPFVVHANIFVIIAFYVFARAIQDAEAVKMKPQGAISCQSDVQKSINGPSTIRRRRFRSIDSTR